MHFTLYSDSDIIFLNKDIVQLHLRDFCTYHIEYITGYLVMRIFKLIDGIIYLVFDHDKLNRDFDFNKNIVQCFSFHNHVQLLNLKTYTCCNLVNHRDFQL